MLTALQDSIQGIADKWLALGYEPILEADVSGWLFCLLSSQGRVNPQQVHLGTRVYGAGGYFFDLAVGSLETDADGRPCVRAQLAVEVKIFPRRGFDAAQHRVHYEHILDDDLPKLGGLDPSAATLASLIVDGAGYLCGTYHGQDRRTCLLNKRNQVAPGAHVFILSWADGNWRVDYDPSP